MGTRYKPKNWKIYNEGMVREGNIFILIAPDNDKTKSLDSQTGLQIAG